MARISTLPTLLGRYDALPLTYPEVGATVGPLPGGYHHVRRRTHIGRGPEQFENAVSALMSWRMHEHSGLHVAAAGPTEEGRTVVMGLGFVAGLVVPCRVVAVIDERARRGFAYGTLPGHPECGEELFLVEQDGDDVWFTVTAFTRPGSRLTQWAGPIARLAQALTTARYERALVSLSQGQ